MLQGSLALKDFDIRKAAGGVQFKTVEKQFKALVSENHLEIHLFWAGKGTCCIPVQGTYGPSISAISVTPGNILYNDKNEDQLNATSNSIVYYDLIMVIDYCVLQILHQLLVTVRRQPLLQRRTRLVWQFGLQFQLEFCA